ncbi:alpha/beta hydrolase [Sphingomonas segetis]|jgi:enterochelin esterase-like enzyme|uniref:alpha/beta hydrolase n=1 Tax=Sphingomonas segetis TaxID=1104779 RepID=UPI0012D3138C|nr:alpha/beta hydrolase-fold protein [Sphingomonas segetis]
MIRQFVFALILLLAAAPAVAQKQDGPPPQVSAGSIVDLGVVQSKYADPRRVVVWLPSGYKTDGPKFSVLYMHDGQNLFDTKTAGYGMEWQIDETLDRLIREKKVRPTIVVGIWSTPKRLQEYVPSEAFNGLPASYRQKVRALYGGDPLSDGYLKFLVRELKPMIDRRFNVRTGPADTTIMGSSMGALISLYAIDEFPRVFGAAGMMSTHWPLVITPDNKPISDEEYEAVSSAFERYLSPALPDPGSHKLYFDHGSETLDANYARYQDRVDAVVKRRGYRQWSSTLSLSFPGQKHNEISWASRVAVPLQFLIGPTPAPSAGRRQ